MVNREDRRVGLLEGLIYAAIVEANLPRIAAEVKAMHGLQVEALRPEIIVLAPPTFWSSSNSKPSNVELARLATEVSTALSTKISLLKLVGAEGAELGAGGGAPSLSDEALVSMVSS